MPSFSYEQDDLVTVAIWIIVHLCNKKTVQVLTWCHSQNLLVYAFYDHNIATTHLRYSRNYRCSYQTCMLFIKFTGDEQATRTTIIEADWGNDSTLATYWSTAACLAQIYDASGDWTSYTTEMCMHGYSRTEGLARTQCLQDEKITSGITEFLHVQSTRGSGWRVGGRTPSIVP